MKTRLVIAGAVLAAGVALFGGAPSAQADPPDDLVAAATRDGIVATSDNIVQDGIRVCDQINGGMNGAQVAQQIMQNNSLDQEHADKFVIDAVTTLCPQFEPGGADNPV